MNVVKKNEEFLENRLKSLIGSSGELRSLYGGFEILITKKGFDYVGVLQELLGANLTVNVEKRDGNLAIIAK